MLCISDVLPKCFNYLLKHMCKFSFTMGKCSYLLSALIELKSLDFSWQAVAEVYCSTGLRKTLLITNPNALLDNSHPSLLSQQGLLL